MFPDGFPLKENEVGTFPEPGDLPRYSNGFQRFTQGSNVS